MHMFIYIYTYIYIYKSGSGVEKSVSGGIYMARPLWGRCAASQNAWRGSPPGGTPRRGADHVAVWLAAALWKPGKLRPCACGPRSISPSLSPAQRMRAATTDAAAAARSSRRTYAAIRPAPVLCSIYLPLNGVRQLLAGEPPPRHGLADAPHLARRGCSAEASTSSSRAQVLWQPSSWPT